MTSEDRDSDKSLRNRVETDMGGTRISAELVPLASSVGSRLTFPKTMRRRPQFTKFYM
jgi:hypothetical protein